MNCLPGGYNEMKSKYIWLLDAGHSGMKDGVYLTAPAKMHTFSDGLTIYEGVINRAIAKKVWLQLVNLSIDFGLIYDEQEDDSLDIRCQRVNNVCAKEERTCILVDIHSNAGGGSGNEIFVHNEAPQRTRKIANIFCETYMQCFPEFHFRQYSANQLYKEANFQMLRETSCPAILIENLFFDHRQQAEYLLSESGQQAIADCIVKAIQNVEKLMPI